MAEISSNIASELALLVYSIERKTNKLALPKL